MNYLTRLTRNFFAFIAIIAVTLSAQQPFPVDTLWRGGASLDRALNLVILGDGYTVAQSRTFLDHARQISDYILESRPFKEYRAFINIVAITTPSNQSGTSREGGCNDPTIRDTYFGTHLCARLNIDRVPGIGNEERMKSLLESRFPQFGHVIMIINSAHGGGTWDRTIIGDVSIAAGNQPFSDFMATVVHEIGHAFAGLGDEYWAHNVGAPNKTQESDPTKINWRNWLGIEDIGIYRFSNNPQDEAYNWFKPLPGTPGKTCKMEYHVGNPFCAFCRETILEKIYEHVNFAVRSPAPSDIFLAQGASKTFSLDLLIPSENTIRIRWSLNGSPVASANNRPDFTLNFADLPQNLNLLTVTVEDTSAMLRPLYRSNSFNEFSWNIAKENGHTLIFNPGDEGFVYPQIMSGIQANGKITLPVALRNGYEFAGWFDESRQTKFGEGGGEFIVTGNVGMYADWTWIDEGSECFGANFKGMWADTDNRNCGNSMFGFGYCDGDIVRNDGRYWRFNNQFGNDDFASLNVRDNAEPGIGENHALMWEEVQCASFAITFFANGGAVDPIRISGIANNARITLPTPTRDDGREFLGWFSELSGGVRFGGGGDQYTVTQRVTMVARWEGEDEGGVSVRRRNETSRRSGILLENAVVSDSAKIRVITPEPAQITVRIFDVLGNVVFTETAVGANHRLPLNQSVFVWNLTNSAGRFVASGTYLIVVQAVTQSGAVYWYRTRIGVKR